ncbi:MAG: phenylalanyl-tRNA synthetase beta chain, partial [Planctomycetota bacterium]
KAGDDYMIELTVTSNRVDCLGMLGLARDFSAATGKPLVKPSLTAPTSNDEAKDVCSVKIEAVEECPRYSAMVIEGVKVGPSPAWMVERLETIGLRTVNNIVDATNYALFVTNQPFHAFDLDKIKDGQIIVRQARAGEKLVAINDKEYELDPSMTLITDSSGPVAIAGVMGGGPTEVSDSTARVLLETAYFEPIRIRKTSKKLGLSSDSSFRFERGIDAEGTLDAAAYCAALIAEVAGGRVRKGAVEENHVAPRSDEVDFRHSEVKRIVGIDVPWDICTRIFDQLECQVTGDPETGIKISPPSYRGDVTREIDLIEEIIRNHGLDKIPEGTSMPVMTVQTNHAQKIRQIVRDVFVASGYQEVLTTSFCSEEDAQGCFFAETAPVTIANAMRKDENALRQSLMPSLLSVRKTNQDHGNANVRLVECTVVYLAHNKKDLPEHLSIASVVSDADFRTVRGDVERVCANLGIRGLKFVDLDDAGKSLLDPNHGATIQLPDGTVIGYVGKPKSNILKRHDLKHEPLYMELRLDRIAEAANLEPKYKPLSRFPAVNRDLAMVVDEGTRWAEITDVLNGLSLDHLEGLDFFDEYRGKQLPSGKKSLAFSLTYRSFERTLTGDEVDASQTRAIKALEEKLGAQIRA